MGDVRLPAVAVMLCALIGCSKADVPRAPSGTIPAGAVPSSPSSADLPARDESLIRDISPPGPSDHAYVTKLDHGIIRLAEDYVELHYHLCKDPGIERKTRVVAARRANGYVLLDVHREGIIDGNVHLVYSEKSCRILGRFCWYVQG